ncbi:signal peptidase I [Caenimonas terrae]|uniref:Signal peptidase I n=1 Tax=Caenimonas terrae TaxID=696074 RepID=A0ABW0NGC6_9BURK
MASWLRRNRGFLLFLLGLALFRTAIADWNPIPSGSMRPTLLEGDVVLVNRTAYDIKLPLTDIALLRLGEPARGDVVTFTSPRDGERLIKRLVALPGDVVEMRDEALYINGSRAGYTQRGAGSEPMEDGSITSVVRATERLAQRDHAVQFLPQLRALRSFGPVVVPPGQYFMLGDNRDDSNDSRYIGFVPRRLLIGRAHHILASADIKGSWAPRPARFGRAID